MVDQRIKDLTGASRRGFLKFVSAVGAGLAVSRTDVLNYIADTGGSAMADECVKRNRAVHLVGGNGGLAWFNLLWPHNDIATSNDPQAAFHAQGMAMKAPDTDKTQYWSPETPWTKLGKNRRMSAYMAGQPQIHTNTPTSSIAVGNGISMLAAAAALHSSLPSLLPVIGVAPFDFGQAPGAPPFTTVGSPDAIVGLFDSAASKQILSAHKDAANYEAYYKAFLGLNRVASRPTYAAQLRITKASANFLGKNLAALLQPKDEDMVRYGIDAGTATKLRDLAFTLLAGVNAFKMGLTNSVIMPVMLDDPHNAFTDMNVLDMTVKTLGNILDQFMNDLESIKDPACGNKSLADTTVITIHGDTPKDPTNRVAWPDNTPGNSNWMWVYGAGYLKTGWFGGVGADGSVRGFDPKTGQDTSGMGGGETDAANAAILYAVSQGDTRAVGDFAAGVGSIGGLVNQQLQ